MLRRSNCLKRGKRFRNFLLLIILALPFGACSAPAVKTEPPLAEPSAETSVPPSPTSAHSTPINPNLAREIDHLIDNGEVASARWGVSVVSLKDSRVVYERNADKLFTPASNMKLFPTAVALEFLGAD